MSRSRYLPFSVPRSSIACCIGMHICIPGLQKCNWSRNGRQRRIVSIRPKQLTIECAHYSKTFQFVSVVDLARSGWCVEKSACLLIQIDLISPNIRQPYAIENCGDCAQLTRKFSVRYSYVCTAHSHGYRLNWHGPTI